jgi:hypothetical protein
MQQLSLWISIFATNFFLHLMLLIDIIIAIAIVAILLHFLKVFGDFIASACGIVMNMLNRYSLMKNQTLHNRIIRKVRKRQQQNPEFGPEFGHKGREIEGKTCKNVH